MIFLYLWFEKFHNALLHVYTYDSFNKDSLNLVFGNFGYTNFCIIITEDFYGKTDNIYKLIIIVV